MSSSSETKTDLLIIGAGPAGLMAASWASRFNIPTRFLDDKPARVQTGHADGLTCRTMEILDSFGLAEIVVRESSHDVQMRSWASTSQRGIERVGTVNTQKPGVSRFQQCTLHQGRIEELFQDMLEREGNIQIERNVQTLELHIDHELAASENAEARPITLKVGRMPAGAETETESSSAAEYTETIHAKYLIGCDGAHSWTRRQLQLELRGDATNAVWGVLDIVPLTNFPDIRQTCVIYSCDHGAIHLVPREGRLVRLYIQLAEATVKDAQQRFDRSSVSPRMLLETARRIIAPYELDYRICDWWSVYQVGQRVADRFSVRNRVFLTGDAIHTHSPKVGQGMNVSMGDAYNLVWKVCSVLRGHMDRAILSTYQAERRSVALALLDADRATTAYYSGRQGDNNHNHAPRKDLQAFRDDMYDFLSGVAVEYADSVITRRHAPDLESKHQIATPPGLYDGTHSAVLITQKHSSPAGNLKIGQRMPAYLVTNMANARSTLLSELLLSTGAWRILVFPGDVRIESQMSKLRGLAAKLVDTRSCLHTYIGSTIEIFTIISGGGDDVPLLSLPAVFHPWDERYGWDYGKVFSDTKSVNGAGGDAYERLGIGKREGCIIVCRPDQHVGMLCGVADVLEMERYFAGFLKPQWPQK